MQLNHRRNRHRLVCANARSLSERKRIIMALLTQPLIANKTYNMVQVTITPNNHKTYKRKFETFLKEQKGFVDPKDTANLPLDIFYRYDTVTIISNNLTTLAFKINDQLWLAQHLTTAESIALTDYLI